MEKNNTEGAFINYVDKLLRIFDPLPLLLTFGYPLSPLLVNAVYGHPLGLGPDLRFLMVHSRTG